MVDKIKKLLYNNYRKKEREVHKNEKNVNGSNGSGNDVRFSWLWYL